MADDLGYGDLSCYGKQFIDRKGYFLPKYEFSENYAQPIFKKDNKWGLPIELPKITVEE